METLFNCSRIDHYTAVFELPMRDGNPTSSFSFPSRIFVFELPMRDGNKMIVERIMEAKQKFLNFL